MTEPFSLSKRVTDGEVGDSSWSDEFEEAGGWTQLLAELRAMNLRDTDDVVSFLTRHFGEDVGDMESSEQAMCADAFVDGILKYA